MHSKHLIYFCLCALLFSACDNNDDSLPDPEGPVTFENGIFVLNEGNFQQGNSSVTYVDPAAGVVLHNIFEGVNKVPMGDTATDLAFFEDQAYIVLNVSNTIEIVDPVTFESIATIDSDLHNPRKIAFSERMLFVTNWGEGSDATDDYVAVFDTQNFQLLTKIPVAEGPEDILSFNGNIFVAHGGGWNFNNKISVITGTEVNTVIEVGEVPNGIAAADGSLWVSSAGLPDYAGETAGSISKIDLGSLTVEKTLSFPDAGQHPANMSHYNGDIYFTLRDEVFSFSTSASELPTISAFPIEEVAYLYGFNIHEGKAYATSANSDFTGNGKLFIYDLAGGNLVGQYDTGINPNGIFFND